MALSFKSSDIKGNEDMEPQHTQLSISFPGLRRAIRRWKKETS